MSANNLNTIPAFQDHSSFSVASISAAGHEPLEAAMLELGRRASALEISREQLHARLEQLRSNQPQLRRRRSRAFLLTLQPQVSFISIEEAAADSINISSPAESQAHTL
jgi:hypothetical protein